VALGIARDNTVFAPPPPPPLLLLLLLLLNFDDEITPMASIACSRYRM
jgi:hypothetical protein